MWIRIENGSDTRVWTHLPSRYELRCSKATLNPNKQHMEMVCVCVCVGGGGGDNHLFGNEDLVMEISSNVLMD